ncbi:hypothetical protein DIZ76_014375 [Coccidioides immitis]|nr:hypothetical protein DIZ76_014375 [Coccidioides immitis]
MTIEDTAHFSSPESPRLRPLGDASCTKFGLPPVSLGSGGSVSTGLQRLDVALALPTEPQPSPFGLGLSQRCLYDSAGGDGPAGGVQRGEVTELVGPRASGKTVLAMSLAAEVLRSQRSVVWVDTAGPMCVSRLESLLHGKENVTEDGPSQATGRKSHLLQRLLHFHPLSLAHLVALVSHPPRGFPPENTGLIVIDSISCLFAAEFRPRLPKRLRETKLSRTEQAKLDKESRLYFNLIGSLVSDLRRLAVRFNCAVVVINEMASRFKPSTRPMLHEVISGFTWDAGVTTRVLLYWHWLPWEMRETTKGKGVRIAEVQKVGGMTLMGRSAKRIVPFTGLQEFLDEESISIPSSMKQSTPHGGMEKRKLDEFDSTPSHRPKLEPTIEIVSPDADDDDDEILDPLPGATEEDYEVPDSESEFDVDEMISIGSRTPSNQVEPDVELLVQHLDNEAVYE